MVRSDDEQVDRQRIQLLGLDSISDDADDIAQNLHEGNAPDADKLGQLLNSELEQFLPSPSR